MKLILLTTAILAFGYSYQIMTGNVLPEVVDPMRSAILLLFVLGGVFCLIKSDISTIFSPPRNEIEKRKKITILKYAYAALILLALLNGFFEGDKYNSPMELRDWSDQPKELILSFLKVHILGLLTFPILYFADLKN